MLYRGNLDHDHSAVEANCPGTDISSCPRPSKTRCRTRFSSRLGGKRRKHHRSPRDTLLLGGHPPEVVPGPCASCKIPHATERRHPSLNSETPCARLTQTSSFV